MGSRNSNFANNEAEINLEAEEGMKSPSFPMRMSAVDRFMWAESNQTVFNKCQAMEADYIECLDNIGPIRAKAECRLFFEDLVECKYQHKQLARLEEMNKRKRELYQSREDRERHKQEWLDRERKRDAECAKSWQ